MEQVSGPHFVILQGSSPGRILPVDGPALILARNKGPGALHDPEVSSKHAEVVNTPAGFLLRDLKSTNGTFVGGQPVQEAILSHGDEILVGRTVLRWENEQPLEVAPPVRPASPRNPTRELRPGNRENVGAAPAGPWVQAAGLDDSPVLIEEPSVILFDDRGHELIEIGEAGLHLKTPWRTSVSLEVVEGPEKGRTLTFERGEAAVGRYGTDMVLRDSDVSRRHSEFVVFGSDQIFVRDLGSTNGTFVNGVRVRFSRVQSGDTVVMGRSLIHVIVRPSE